MTQERRETGALRASVWAVLEALAVGVVAWVICMWVLAPVHGASPWNADDYVDYCNGVASVRGDAEAIWPVKRSHLPAFLPAIVARRLGVTAGLAVGASVGTVVAMAATYAWARVLAGRAAGVVAIAAALALVPVSQSARLLSFYPQVNAVLLVGAAAVAWGVRQGGVRGSVAVACGAALALCADARGLAWALPWLAGAGCVGLWRRARGGSVREDLRGSVGAAALVLGCGWLLGRLCYPEDAASFESQLDPRPIFHAMGSTDPAHQPPFDSGGNFVWGRSSPHRLVETVAFVARTLALRPPDGFPPAIAKLDAAAILGPLDVAWGVAVVAAAGVVARDRARAFALLVSVGPYLLAWRGQHSVAQVYARFLQQLLPALAVLVGVGVARGVQVAAGWAGPQKLKPALAGASLVAWLVALGVIPTPLSPWAAWRRPWPYVGQLDEVDPRNPIPAEAGEDMLACRAAIARDVAHGAWFPHRRR